MRRAQNPSRCARPLERSPHARAEYRYLCRQAGAGDRQGKHPHRDRVGHARIR